MHQCGETAVGPNEGYDGLEMELRRSSHPKAYVRSFGDARSVPTGLPKVHVDGGFMVGMNGRTDDKDNNQ